MEIKRKIDGTDKTPTYGGPSYFGFMPPSAPSLSAFHLNLLISTYSSSISLNLQLFPISVSYHRPPLSLSPIHLNLLLISLPTPFFRWPSQPRQDHLTLLLHPPVPELTLSLLYKPLRLLRRRQRLQQQPEQQWQPRRNATTNKNIYSNDNRKKTEKQQRQRQH